jgi:hypothetical protein
MLHLPTSPSVRADIHPLAYASWAVADSAEINNTQITMKGKDIVAVNADEEQWELECEYQDDLEHVGSDTHLNEEQQHSDSSTDTSTPASPRTGLTYTAHTHDPRKRPVINVSRGCAKGYFKFLRHVAADACLAAEDRTPTAYAVLMPPNERETYYPPLHVHPRIRPLALLSHRRQPLLLPPLAARQYGSLVHIAMSTAQEPHLVGFRNLATCPVGPNVCPGELESGDVTCQLNVGTPMDHLPAHCTSLAYLYAIEYARAYFRVSIRNV